MSKKKTEDAIKLLKFLLTLDDLEIIKISIEGIIEVLEGNNISDQNQE